MGFSIATSVFYSLSIVLFIYSKLYQKKLERKLAVGDTCSSDEFKKYADAFLSNGIRCKVNYGKLWGYDIKENVLSVPQKECYAFLDKFIFLHEVGHRIDSNGKYKDICSAVLLLRIIKIVLYIPIIFFAVLVIAKDIANVFLIAAAVNCLLITGLVIELVLTVIFEKRASAFALANVGQSTLKKHCVKIADYALIDQIVVKSMIIFPVAEIIVCILIKI